MLSFPPSSLNFSSASLPIGYILERTDYSGTGSLRHQPQPPQFSPDILSGAGRNEEFKGKGFAGGQAFFNTVPDEGPVFPEKSLNPAVKPGG